MLYAAEYSTNGTPSIAQYRLDDGTLVRRIAIGEYRIDEIAVDRHGTVYAIEERDNQERRHFRVAEYAPGGLVPARTIEKGNWQPDAMLFNGRGDLYVLDRTSKIHEFKPGASESYAVVTDGLQFPTAMTRDPNGKLYVANATSTVHSWGSITAYASGRRLVGTIADRVLAPDGVALDGRGTLYVTDPIGYGSPDNPSIAQYATSDGHFIRSVTVTKDHTAFMSPGLAADSAGNIYTHIGGCVTIVGGPTHCVDSIFEFPPTATVPSHVYDIAKGEAFSSIAFDRAAGMYLAVCSGTKAACAIRAYAPGEPPRTLLRTPDRTIGAITIAP
jgi:sugar lactone lactonase YvrE